MYPWRGPEYGNDSDLESTPGDKVCWICYGALVTIFCLSLAVISMLFFCIGRYPASGKDEVLYMCLCEHPTSASKGALWISNIRRTSTFRFPKNHLDVSLYRDLHPPNCNVSVGFPSRQGESQSKPGKQMVKPEPCKGNVEGGCLI